jgi:predicted lipoprotein with Yx(FWY)xxD motif
VTRLSVCTAILAATATIAFAAPPSVVDSADGQILVGDEGMTLYIFDKDASGASNCVDKCAENWPPLMAADEDEPTAAPFSIIERADGSYQWAMDGMPLYYWIKDAKPGDVTGDGVNDVWHVARP